PSLHDALPIWHLAAGAGNKLHWRTSRQWHISRKRKRSTIMSAGSTSNPSQGRRERQIEVLSNNEYRTGMMSGLSLLGGVAIGAGLMYLLDPEQGPDRRKTIRNAAGG